MSCGVGHRHSLDLASLWLAAAAPIRPLAWEPPYAAGVALKRQKKILLSVYCGLLQNNLALEVLGCSHVGIGHKTQSNLKNFSLVLTTYLYTSLGTFLTVFIV